MSNYRRIRVPGACYFFTIVTHCRARTFSHPLARRLLGEKIRACQSLWPFQIDALVLLPDHFHTMWTLPDKDNRYSMRLGWLKKEFTKVWLAAGGREQSVSDARRRRGDRGIWQRRFWEHQIRDDRDFERHLDYVHYNPVKHGYAKCPKDWLYSTFHRWVERGVYPRNWGCFADSVLRFDDLDETAME